MKKNCVHIYYGYGKGKSTAAAGLAARAIGAGKRVLAVYFLKDGSSSETTVLQNSGVHILFSENCKYKMHSKYIVLFHQMLSLYLS